MAKKALGKGLGSLMGTAEAETAALEPDSTLPISKIIPNKDQPRKLFKEAELTELSDSIKQNGILQPLLVRKKGTKYEIVAGERRYQAAKLAGLEEVPVIIKEISDAEVFKLALIENLQRRDLDYMEEAAAIARLLRRYGLSQQQAAEKLGRSQSAVANKLRLLKLSPEVLEVVKQGSLSERHARSLLRLPEDQRLAAAKHMVKEGLTVAKAEAYVDKLLSPPAPVPAKKMPVYHIRDVRFFLNTIDRSVRLMQSAGVRATSRQDRKDGVLTLTVRIPMEENSPH